MIKESQTSIFDVAKYILELLDPDDMPIDQVSLYKLLWFCHGWHFHVADGPLFKESFEARKYGPVPPDMWNIFKGMREVFESELEQRGNVDNIDVFSKEVIKKVVNFYSQFDSNTLSELSHHCTPWENNVNKKDKTIPNEEIRDFFNDKSLIY